MSQRKATKKSLMASTTSLVLCIAMLAGSTYAWFSDDAHSGQSRIVSGNLDIEVEYNVGNSGTWQSVEEPISTGTKPFETADKSPWEPGKVVYQEYQVINKGNLAAYYKILLNTKANVVLTYNDGDGTYDYREGDYVPTLMDKVQYAVYQGTFAELKKDVEDAGYAISDDREVVTKAFEDGLLYFDHLLGDGSAGVYYDGLAPSGKSVEMPIYDPDKIYSSDSDEDIVNRTVDDTSIFTVIAYWIPGQVDTESGHFEDNYYNLNDNKKKASNKLCSLAEIDDLMNGISVPDFKSDSFDEEGLKINFDIITVATQNPYEEDSFGIHYDENAASDAEFGPEIP